MIKLKKILAAVTVLSLFAGMPTVKAAEKVSPVEVSAKTFETTASDIVWENSEVNEVVHYSTASPINSYKGAKGVTIRSYSNTFKDTEKLKEVYDELMQNTIGAEISHLAFVDLVPDYPRGRGIAGLWYGQWTSTGKLSAGRRIEIYGCDTIDFDTLASVLSHEYGHHFTYYHTLNKEGKTPGNTTSGYYKVRNLGSYKLINSGYHAWAPEEIAAEDYKQLFGSPRAKKSHQFLDIRDKVSSNITNFSYSSTMFNYYPQENYYLPLAWQVSGLYSYWTSISGVNPPNKVPPTAPILSLAKVEKINTFWGVRNSATITWTKSNDDTTDDMEYTVVYFKDNVNDPSTSLYLPIRTTTDAKGRDAIVGAYVAGNKSYADGVLDSKVTVRVYAKDKDGNIVASNDLVLDPENLVVTVTKPYDRIAGINRYSTSIKISQQGWTGGSDTVVLATGADFPDALSAAPLAKKHNAPIILTEGKGLSSETEKEIERLGAKNVIVVGGPGAISGDIILYLRGKGYNVTRIAGKDRYETSIEIAKQLGDFESIVVATGRSFPDALSIAPYAASKGLPIILTAPNQLPDAVKSYISTKNINKAFVIGGTGAVSEAVKDSLPLAERISGINRYETNKAVLDRFELDFDLNILYLATGDNFPDALSGSALAALTKSPIVLTSNSNVKTAKEFVSSKFDLITKINFVGGAGVISDSNAYSITTK